MPESRGTSWLALISFDVRDPVKSHAGSLHACMDPIIIKLVCFFDKKVVAKLPGRTRSIDTKDMYKKINEAYDTLESAIKSAQSGGILG